MRKRFENQMHWRNKINDALMNNMFELHYQPIVGLEDNSLSHYEVLIRMKEKDGNIVLPAPFIAVAEKTGLINAIDHFVLETAINEIKQHNLKGQKIKLAINLSAHSFGDEVLFGLLKRLLEASEIDPAQLIFEITETAALSDLTAASELIGKIRSLGCYFALDDFGVGFSSFYYLKELPVDYVKIDGSFIQKLPSNRNDQILVKAITEIAKEFGKKTIAEFVEDRETIELLKKYEVDFVQGYYVGMPEKMVA
ncbi:MAG: EAL domain-containing protein, partial [Gammaproteobacteria bacterium]|nr:EAL domain-containing protein [Gammaproteobacteria bacterium]